jgi:PTH1 family peptidyl-tRNA hydrolase
VSESFAAKLKLNLLRPKAEVIEGDLFLVVGLGNPGREYQETRHNAGFMVIDRLAADAGASLTRVQHKALVAQAILEEKKVVLAKPQTYMNLSGEAVSGLARFYKIPPERILVVHDDLDLPFGMLRMRASGSSAGQKGMLSILTRMGTEDIPRLRFGIGRPSGSKQGANYVLKPFNPQERKEMDYMVAQATDAVRCFLREGVESAMNKYNRMQLEG